jgi:hypothetical protein
MTKPFTPDEIIKAVGIRLGELRQALAELAREHAALREQVAELRGEMRGYTYPAAPPERVEPLGG